MITVDKTSLIQQDAFTVGSHAVMNFNGLAADTKPMESWQGIAIDNGSTFMELDTKKVFFYDAENKLWK